MKILKIIGPMAIIALIILSPEAKKSESDSLISLSKIENIALAQDENGCMTWCWGNYVPCGDSSCETDCDQEPGNDNTVEDYEWYSPPIGGEGEHGPNAGCYEPNPSCCYYSCNTPIACT